MSEQSMIKRMWRAGIKSGLVRMGIPGEHAQAIADAADPQRHCYSIEPDDMRAALAAMREPTEAMIAAARLQMPAEREYWQENGILHARMLSPAECVDPANVIRAAIDAALVEAGKE